MATDQVRTKFVVERIERSQFGYRRQGVLTTVTLRQMLGQGDGAVFVHAEHGLLKVSSLDPAALDGLVVDNKYELAISPVSEG